MKITFTTQKIRNSAFAQKLKDKVSHFVTKPLKPDSFERQSNIQEININIYNPYSGGHSYNKIKINPNEAQFITLDKNDNLLANNAPLSLYYNPALKGTVKSKLTNKKIDVVILRSSFDTNLSAYHIMSKNLDKEYGYVVFKNFIRDGESIYAYKNPSEEILMYSDLLKDYPEYDIQGSRIVVEMLLNCNKSKISGIGKIADKMAVYECMLHGIEPNIVSDAVLKSHIAHYLRGKRFLPIEESSKSFDFFQTKYGTTDVNEIIKELLKNNKKHGHKIDISDWEAAPTYLPKDIASKYKEEIIREHLPL